MGNYSLWGGGSTTVVTPDTGDVILAELECVPSVVKYKVHQEQSPRPRANKRKAEEEQVDVSNWEQRNRTLEEEVAALRAEKEELQYILDAHRSTCSLQVKGEQVELEPLQLSQGKEELIIKPEPRQRPGSLSLTPVTVKNIEGVSIDTPSNAILSFNTLLEGRTGLTPTNILTPTSLWTPIKTSSNLNTPNCSAQQRSSVTDLLSPCTQALLTSL